MFHSFILADYCGAERECNSFGRRLWIEWQAIGRCAAALKRALAQRCKGAKGNLRSSLCVFAQAASNFQLSTCNFPPSSSHAWLSLYCRSSCPTFQKCAVEKFASCSI